jgi:hypothetical protein
VVDDDAGSRVYTQTTPVADALFSVGGDRSWTDVRATTRVKVTGAADDAVVLLAVRYGADGSGYRVEYEAAGSIRLRKRTPESSFDLSARIDVPVSGDTFHEIALEVAGGELSLHLDGELVHTATDADPLVAGGIALGVMDGTASFDEVRVTEP